MTKIPVTAKRDHIETLTVTSRPLLALAELIWNGFDANSDRVQVHFDLNKMDGINSIRVRDYGNGIDFADSKHLFGNLGDSWKKKAGRTNGRSLHGKNGKGRFKAFGLGEMVEWCTTYQCNGKKVSYKITGKSSMLDDFESSAPIDVTGIPTGTEVIISNLKKHFHSLIDDSSIHEITKIFASYLTEYPNLTLEYNGLVIDPEEVQDRKRDYPLGDIILDGGRSANGTISIIEWKIPTERVLHLCDASGIPLAESKAGQQIKAPGFHFTAYVKSDHLRKLDEENLLALDEMHRDAGLILKAAKARISDHFRRRLAENYGKIVERWKEEQIYPYEDKPDIGSVEEAERQVFDILAANVQSYLPSFEDADLKSKKFTFRLLAQAIKENPESVQEIVGEVLGLKKEAQIELATLLKKTPLSSIISSAKTVANRLDFLVGLENLLFDKENKEKLLERDQLHKILENEAWLFHEEFSLAGSEMRLEEVLSKHLAKLGSRSDDADPVFLSDGKTGRIDLMLQKAIQPRNGEYDYLVVELKRPSKKIDSEVLTQIEKYAIAVASDERFLNVNARWTFIVISNNLDSYAQRKSNQRNMPKGLVFDDADLNIRVWAKSWAEVISDANSRLRFVNEQLSYTADKESSTAYLKMAHAKFIPNLDPKNEPTEAK